MRFVATIGLAALLCAAACGQRPADVGSAPDAPLDAPGTPLVAPGRQPLNPGKTPPADPSAALAAWKSFPVERRPRPVVLLQKPPVLEGFRTGDAKLAALNGNYELSTELPATPPVVTARLPDGPAEFRTLPVEDALTGLQAGPASPKPNPTDALPITRVELGSAEFMTDRGGLTLPAWLFHAADALGPIAWPALPPDAFWPIEPRPSAALQPAKLHPDGTLTVTLPAPSPACPGEPIVRHDPQVTESATAVSVGVRVVTVSTAPGPPRENCAHDTMMRLEQHHIRLAAPLGGRVLVDHQGSPIAVG